MTRFFPFHCYHFPLSMHEPGPDTNSSKALKISQIEIFIREI